MRKQNWTFVIVEIIILIFFMGVTYARINTVELQTGQNLTAIEKNELRIETKASRSEVMEIKNEMKEYNREMKEDLLKAIDDLKKEVRIRK